MAKLGVESRSVVMSPGIYRNSSLKEWTHEFEMWYCKNHSFLCQWHTLWRSANSMWGRNVPTQINCPPTMISSCPHQDTRIPGLWIRLWSRVRNPTYRSAVHIKYKWGRVTWYGVIENHMRNVNLKKAGDCHRRAQTLIRYNHVHAIPDSDHRPDQPPRD